MQEEFKDFDLEVRSMLEDAEVKPSHRVWKGISSRLDAASAAGSESPAWMRWAGAALAFAAALGLGVFLVGTQPKEIPSSEDVALVAEVPGSLQGSQDFQTDATGLLAEAVPQQEATRRREASLPGGVAAADNNNYGAIADNDSAEAAIVAEPAGEQEEAAAEKRASVSSRPGAAYNYSSEEDSAEEDGFALLEAEDARRGRSARRTALYLKGAVGGNDSDMRTSRPYAAMAPGNGTSGISELSTSTYGVPFTLGLGVRFYLVGGLSIGTGIDYSLLTRTFTGKYDGTAGNVSHTLQYIGVPLGLYYDLLSFDKVKFYVYGLGEAEYCISNRYTLYASPNVSCSDKVEKLQYSVGAGLGLEFRLSRMLGLYIDPGLRYYFPCDQPKSVRTDKPVSVNFDAGLRFNF
jgi:hypothetical protein